MNILNIHTFIYIYMCVCVHASVSVYIYIYICLCVCVGVGGCLWVSEYVCIPVPVVGLEPSILGYESSVLPLC